MKKQKSKIKIVNHFIKYCYQLLTYRCVMTKKRIWDRKKLVFIIIMFVVMIASSSIGIASQINSYEQEDTYKINGQKKVQKVVKQEKDKELSVKEYVKQEIEKAGLNWKVAECVISRESNFNPNAIGETKDYGLMQYNIQHIKSGFISLECAGNVECSLKKAIEKVKKDGQWCGEKTGKGCTWYGYRDANCKRFGNTFIN